MKQCDAIHIYDCAEKSTKRWTAKASQNKFIWESLFFFLFFLSLFSSHPLLLSLHCVTRIFRTFLLSCSLQFNSRQRANARKNNYCIWSYFRSLKLGKTIKWSSNCMWNAASVRIRTKQEWAAFECFHAWKLAKSHKVSLLLWNLKLFQKARRHKHTSKIARGRKTRAWLLCLGAVGLGTLVCWKGWWKSLTDPDDTQTHNMAFLLKFNVRQNTLFFRLNCFTKFHSKNLKNI